MGRFNKYSDSVEVGRKAEKKYLLGAESASTTWVMLRLFGLA
jgi:hypothetical protein